MSAVHRAVWILAALLVAPVWAAQSPGNLAAAFGASPQQSEVTLSPDGRMLAWRQRSGSGVEIIIFDLHSHVVVRTLQVDPTWRIGSLLWEDDDTLLMGVQFRERLPTSWNWDSGRRSLSMSLVVAVDVASGKSRELLVDRMFKSGISLTTTGEEGGLASAVHLLAWDLPQPHTVIMSTEVWSASRYRSGTGTLIHGLRRDSGFVGAVFSVDTRTGKDEPIAYGDAYTAQWVADDAGQVVARTEWHPRDLHFSIYARSEGTWRRIYQRTGADAPRILGFDAQTHAIVARISDNGLWRVWKIPLDGSLPRPMLSKVSAPVESVEFARFSDKPVLAWVGRTQSHRIWLDTAAQERYESVAHAFPGRTVTVYDHSKDGKEVLAKVEDAATAPMYYLIDFATHKAMVAGEAYPQLAHVPLSTPRVLHYQTPDGQVDARLFLPNGGGKRLPLVVVPPGGPETNDSTAFDWFAQYLAARGYAVLRPDVTLASLPSQGGWIGWGGATQRYAVEGVRSLVKQGVADPRRVCIVGVGYGGYAALAGAAFFPRTYACAVSINGFSDLSSLLGYERRTFGGKQSDNAYLADWHTRVGSQGDPKVIEASPVDAAKAITAPVLLVHDEGDVPVPVGQSMEMNRALEKLGKPVTFMKLPGKDHGLARGKSRIEVLQDVGRFLNEYLH